MNRDKKENTGRIGVHAVGGTIDSAHSLAPARPTRSFSITRHLSSRSEYVASLPRGGQPQSGTDVFLREGDVGQIQRSVREQCHDAVRWLRG